MSEDRELISNERLVRELRIKIRNLTKDFDKKFGKASRNVKDRTVRYTRMSIYKDDRENDRFYHKLEAFDIDKDNDDELREMDKNLYRLRKVLERRLKDLRMAREDYEIEDIATEIQKAIQKSPIMQRLLPDELKQRVQNLKYSSEMSKSDYINLIKAEIKQINFERDSAKAVIIANSDPELKKTFDELMECSVLINEEAEYRDAQRDVTRRYNELCRGYAAIEKIEQELSDPNISAKRRNELLDLRRSVLLDLRESMQSKGSVTKDGTTTVNKDEFIKTLKAEIESLAFEKNALNGIVDPNVVARDKITAGKSDFFEIFDKFESLTELENAKRKRPIMKENPDFSRYLKSLELKMVMQELALTYKQKSELDEIRNKLAELDAKKDLTQAELEERSRLGKKQIDIHRGINNISNRIDRIKRYGKELGIPCIVDGSLDLNSAEQLTGIGVSQVEASIKKQKRIALEERKEVCKKYGIDVTLSGIEIATAIEEKVKEIESKKGRRIIDLEYEAPKDGMTLENGQTATNYLYEDKKVIQAVKVYDVQSQLDTTDPQYKQRVEFGKVYRYEKGQKDGELLLVEEDLEVYLENPKKKLNEILDGLRDKVLAEFPNEKELENYCDSAKSEEFKGLVSKNPIKRARAKKELIRKIEQANGDKPTFGYINMAIALNSELLPDSIDETLGRISQPYGKRESDMIKYVKIKGRNSIFGRSEKGEIVSSRLSDIHVESIQQEEKSTSTINLKISENGMVRPFEINPAEMGVETAKPEEPQKTDEPQKKRTRNRGKKRKDKSPDGEIE